MTCGAHIAGRSTPVHVAKHDGSYHRRIPARYVAGDPPLHVVSFAAGDPVSRTPELADDHEPCIIEWDAAIYLFEDRWYNVERSVRDGRVLFYTNIASPVRFTGREFHYVDYDFDVWWWSDGEPELLDEDEFLDHSAAMSYPAGVIQAARAAVDEVLGLIKARAFPFDRA